MKERPALQSASGKSGGWAEGRGIGEAVAAFDEGFFHEMPGESGDAEGCEQSQEGCERAAQTIDARRRAKQEVMDDMEDGGVNDVHAIGNRAQFAQGFEAHDARKPGFSADEDEEQ